MAQKLLAQFTLPGGQAVETPDGFIDAGSLTGIIQWVIIVLVAIGIIAALIFIILGSIKWITSGGDKEKLQSARTTIIYSIIGLIVVILSVIIMQVVGGLLFSSPSGTSDGTRNCIGNNCLTE